MAKVAVLTTDQMVNSFQRPVAAFQKTWMGLLPKGERAAPYGRLPSTRTLLLSAFTFIASVQLPWHNFKVIFAGGYRHTRVFFNTDFARRRAFGYSDLHFVLYGIQNYFCRNAIYFEAISLGIRDCLKICSDYFDDFSREPRGRSEAGDGWKWMRCQNSPLNPYQLESQKKEQPNTHHIHQQYFFSHICFCVF